MKRFSACLLLVALAAAGTAMPACAQTFADASITLEKAVHAELVSGDMDQAIMLYRQVAESIAASREDIATALIALGRSYELAGSDQAATAYSRLVSEFPDQPEAFLSAHEALARLAPSLPAGAAPAAERDYTIMLDDAAFGAHNGPFGREHDISADGKTIVFGAPTLPYRAAMYPELENELYFVESGSSVMRPVIEDAGDWVGARFNRWLPRWSPDGKQLLFKARMRNGGEDVVFARRDLSANTTVLMPKVPTRYDMTWMPDSKRFVTISRGSFELFSSEGELIRHFDTDSVATRIGGVSPDGRYLAYLKNNEAGAGYTFNFNIWLLDLRSGEHIQVSRDDGFKGVPAWTRDSKAVFYTTISPSHLYKKTIGTEEEPEQITFYNNASVRHPVVLSGTGELTFALVSETSTVLTAPASAPEMAREIVAGYGPMLGPDGGTIYFWDYGRGRRGLWSTTVDGASPKHLISVEGSELIAGGATLSPDGTRIAYFLGVAEGSVLYTVPSSGGAPRRLHVAKDAEGAVAWSPDSKELAFADGPDLMVMPASGGSAQSLASARRWLGEEIAWSPDGKLVSGFAYFDNSGNNLLYTVNRQTRELVQLSPADELTYKEGLSWHPDGDRISYMTSVDSAGAKKETRIASVTGGPVVTLFDGSEPFANNWGTWGPDGRYYFLETGGPGVDLFVSRGDGNEARPFYQTIDNRGIWPLPSWSRDGSVITWSENSARTQIWSVTDRE